MKLVAYFFHSIKRKFFPSSQLIKSQNRLIKVCKRIYTVNQLAVDTEFMREKTYYPLLCLIQINVAGRCYIIDTLSKDIDLTPFFKILEDDKIKKIFHSSHQDLEALTHLLKKTPKSITDTQIMANFCGMDYNISYAKLVKELLGKNLDKDWQRSDWQNRPLHKEQIKYALIDVLYLLKINQLLTKKLIKLERVEWLEEEMKRLSDIKNYDIENQDLYKKFPLANRGSSYKENITLLVNWRDKTAKKRNVPRSYIIKDELLIKIANSNPTSFENLEKSCKENKFLPAAIKKEIFQILQNRTATTEPELDSHQKINFRLNDKQSLLYQKSRQLLQRKAKEYNLKAQFIINQNDLKQIILGNKEIKHLLTGWRHKVLGKDLKRIISNFN